MSNMSRCAIVALLVSLSLPICTSAQDTTATPDLAFSGQSRIRVEFEGRDQEKNSETVAYMVRLRSGLIYHPLSWLTLGGELQYSGSGGTKSTNEGFGPYRLYVQLDSLFGSPLSATLGRQEISIMNERLVGRSNWSNTGRIFDGISLRYGLEMNPGKEKDSSALMLFAAQLGDVIFQASGDRSIAGLWGRFDIAPEMTLDVLGLFDNYEKSAAPVGSPALLSNERYSTGAMLTGGVGKFGYRLEGFGQFGQHNFVDGDHMDIGALLLSGEASMLLLKSSKTRIHALCTMLSGDDEPDDDVDNRFNTVFGTNHRPYGIIDIVPTRGNEGLIDIAAGVRTSPAKNISCSLDGHVFYPHKDSQNSDPLGTEIDLILSWKPSPPFELSGGAAAFLLPEFRRFPGGIDVKSDDSFWAYIMGVWNF